jgi:hypothetical protein
MLDGLRQGLVRTFLNVAAKMTALGRNRRSSVD